MKFRVNNNLIAVGFLLLILVGIFSFIKVIDSSYHFRSPLLTMDDGWTVSYNGRVLAEDQNLNDIEIPSTTVSVT